MKQGLVLTGVGIVVGLAGAFGLNRLIASLLFGVQPTDPVTIVGVVGDHRAGRGASPAGCPPGVPRRVDPNIVLRQD